MTASNPLPTFFGRFTAVLSEHEALWTILRKLGEMAAALEAGQGPTVELEPARLVVELQLELSRHFASEEASGHYGTVARECPVLLPKIVELKADHGAMLAAAQGIALMATDEARHRELPLPVLQLIAALRTHELEENELLREYFQHNDAERD